MCNSCRFLYNSLHVCTAVLFFVVTCKEFAYFPERLLRYVGSRNSKIEILIPGTNDVYGTTAACKHYTV